MKLPETTYKTGFEKQEALARKLVREAALRESKPVLKSATRTSTSPVKKFDDAGFNTQIGVLAEILQSLQGKDPNDAAQQKSFSDMMSWMESSANRTASSTAGSYAARQLAAGLDASSASLVGAQAKFPVFGKMAESKLAFDTQQNAEQYQRNALRGEIAKALASLRLDYARTVNEFNFKTNRAESEDSRWQQDFNLDAPLKTGQLSLQDLQIEAARMAQDKAKRIEDASRTDPLEGFNPGYITNSGPLRFASGPGVAPSTVYSGLRNSSKFNTGKLNPLTGLPL